MHNDKKHHICNYNYNYDLWLVCVWFVWSVCVCVVAVRLCGLCVVSGVWWCGCSFFLPVVFLDECFLEVLEVCKRFQKFSKIKKQFGTLTFLSTEIILIVIVSIIF